MMLTDVIEAYLNRQRSLGMRFESAGDLLHRFGRAMGERPIEEVTAEAVLNFLNGSGTLTATWMLKHRVLSGLYRFVVSRGYVDSSPLPTTLPQLPPQQTTKRISPHMIRHTTAVHLLRAGVDINTIRAWLGHVSLDTTHIYAEVDLEMKAKALAKVDISGLQPKPWQRPLPSLMTFLKAL